MARFITTPKRWMLTPKCLTLFCRHDSSVTTKHSDLVFRARCMHDYHEDKAAVTDLFRRCDAMIQASKSTTVGIASSALFHCEFTDYFRCMDQYPESYCQHLVQISDGRVVAAGLGNVKRVHFGPYLMTSFYHRLLRVDPNKRRQNLMTRLFQASSERIQFYAPDYYQNYTLITNTASLGFQHSLSNGPNEIGRLNIFIIRTSLDVSATQLHKLTQVETEHLWMVDMVEWINRPVLSDLRRIIRMEEYVGTFAVGDIASGRFAVASVWQPVNAVICDDRSGIGKAYRGPFRLVFNLFHSSTETSQSNDEMQMLLTALSNMTATDGIPFMLCHVDQLSPYNTVCQQRALAMTTERWSKHVLTPRAEELEDKFDKLPLWLDPRDFSSLLYFGPLSEKA